MSKRRRKRDDGRLHVDRWADGKRTNLLAIGLAQWLAVAAPYVFGLIGYVRDRTLDLVLPARPSLDVWLELYTDHRRITQRLADVMCDEKPWGVEVQQGLDKARRVSVWAKSRPDELRARIAKIDRGRLEKLVKMGMRAARRGRRMNLLALRRTLRGDWRDIDKEDDFGEVLGSSPEVYFYVRVVLPCVCVYRTAPALLLRRAERDDPDAIEKLLRLDDSAQHFPAVIAWKDKVSGRARLDRIAQIGHWVTQGLDHGQFTIRQVKVSVAGLILAVADVVGKHWVPGKPGLHQSELKQADILELFHTVERDRKGGSVGVYDEDIVDLETGSWRRMVSDQRKLWARFLKMEPGPKFGRV